MQVKEKVHVQILYLSGSEVKGLLLPAKGEEYSGVQGNSC